MQNDFRNGLCVKHLIGKVVLHQFLGPFSFEVHFQYDHRWRPSLIKMFGLVKIQEMIPGNKHILLKTSFSCEMQQVIWAYMLYMAQNRKKMKLVDGGHLEFRYLDSSKYKNDDRNRLSMPHLVAKVILHGFYDHLLLSYIFNMAAGGHLEFLWLDWSKCKNEARNGFSMPKLVGKVVLHSIRCQFVFKIHFQYGRRRPFWILASHVFRRHFREGHGG